MGRSESPGEKKAKKAKKTKRSDSAGKKNKKLAKRKSSASAERQQAQVEDPEAATRSGPKLAFRFAERGSKDGLLGDSRVPADFVQGGRFQRRRPKEEELRRRSFTVEELAALASLAGSGLQAVKAQAADGQGMAVHLTSALNAARKLGQAEKVLMKAILEPSEPDEPLGIGPELIQAFGLVPKVRAPEDSQVLANPSDVPPPPPSSGTVPSTFTSPPPPPPAPGDLANLLPKKRTVPLEEWPSPSADAVQQMLERFPQLDGLVRGSLMNLPPQFALAILWDMDAKGGPEEIRNPQDFVFSAAQTLLRLPMPMGGCAPAVPPGASLAPVGAPGLGLPVPAFVGAT